MGKCQAKVVSIRRYAVKGLGADRLRSVDLCRGRGLPNDRRWGLLFRRSGQPVVSPCEWLHKENFVCCFSQTRLLAQLVSRFDDARNVLQLKRRGERAPHMEVRLDDSAAGERLAAWFSAECGRPCDLVDAGALHQLGNTRLACRAAGGALQ